MHTTEPAYVDDNGVKFFRCRDCAFLFPESERSHRNLCKRCRGIHTRRYKAALMMELNDILDGPARDARRRIQEMREADAQRDPLF